MGGKKWAFRALSIIWMAVMLLGVCLPRPVWAAAVEDRIKTVAGIYPSGSYYNGYETVTVKKGGIWRSIVGHECAGFVMYVTRQTFQEPYYIGSPSYRQVGKTVSTKNTKDVRRLFSRAKIGDVICWTGGGGRHQAIFLKKSSLGIQVYEANFGSDYNRVWYHHLWSFNNRPLWTGTSSSVSVFRYRNYEKVDRMVRKVSLNKKKLTLKKGEKFRLTVTLTPSNAYKKRVSWKSSAPKTVRVDASGNVRGLRKGTATITAAARDGSGKKAVCKITVK